MDKTTKYSKVLMDIKCLFKKSSLFKQSWQVKL